jgi:lipid A ethanolaminephosphotransferase
MPARSRYWRIVRSPFVFAIVVSLVLVSFYNWRFWSETIEATHPATVEDFLFLLSLFVILVLAHVTVFLLLPNPKTLRIAAASVFTFSAATAFFIDSYNVNIDKEMIRNLFETDTQEASAFIVPRLGLYLILLGVVPAVFALRTRLVSPPLGRRLAQRTAPPNDS